MKELTDEEKKKLIKKYEVKNQTKKDDSYKKEMYLKQTDRNYKDGDRN